MKPQMKARIITCIAILLLIGILVAMTKVILHDSFVNLEMHYALRNLQIATATLGHDRAALAKDLNDWLALDQVHAVPQHPGPPFIDRNLPASTLERLKFNLVVFSSPSGRAIHGAGLDRRGRQRADMPEGTRDFLLPGSPLLSLTGARSGIILHPDGPMFVASAPLKAAGDETRAAGVVVVGRFIDTKRFRDVAYFKDLPVDLQLFDSPALPADFNVVRRQYRSDPREMTIPLSEKVIGTYTVLRDISGKPSLILRVLSDRDVYEQWLGTIRYFVLWFALVALVGALIINALFDRLVLSKQKGKESEERFKSVVKQASEGIVIVDFKDKRILEGNAAFYNLLGITPDEGANLAITDLIVDDNAPATDHTIQRLLKGKREMKLRRKDGAMVDVEVSASFLSHHESDAVCFLVHDMTERKRFEERLLHEATHDPLTGLPNRSLLNDFLQRTLAYDKRHRMALAVFLLDLDNFKIVNDTLGHEAGDRLLQQVSLQLMQCMRKYDMVARLGGDEFAIVLPDIREGNEVDVIAEKIIALFSQPFQVAGHELFITCSIGIALSDRGGDSVESLMRNADIAMYHVKTSGRNGYQVFTEDMKARIGERLEMENKLRRALERNEFLLHYQPQVDVTSGAIVGLEALLRWRPEETVIVPPTTFLPLLEETGIIVSVGEWVIREACRQNKAWQDAGLPPMVVSTNISARQFYQKNLPEVVGRILRETGLSPGHLKIELTESIIMQDVGEAVKQLNLLKEMGIALSIDDFGTGYSSLNYLKRFPVDELKIDRSFVMGLVAGGNDATLVSTIISMAHSMNLNVVAEGVETAQQLGFLKERNCQEVQGFFFSKPLSPQLLEIFVRNGIETVSGQFDEGIAQEQGELT
jgi:diguanylate cyclase (GGDEF)-like protein/PAS domain S-box-containing protein